MLKKLNIDDKVRIMLTTNGLDILINYYKMSLEKIEAMMDSDGYIVMPLNQVMALFGNFMSCEPFSRSIIINDDNLKNTFSSKTK